MAYKHCSKKSANSCQILGKASLCNSKCRTPKPSSELWHHQMERKSDGSPHLLPQQQSDKVKAHVFPCSWPHGNICSLLLNAVPCPFILTSKCMLSTQSDSGKALLKVLSTCKNRLPWVQQMLTPISQLSPFWLPKWFRYIENKRGMKARKLSCIWLLGFENCYFCKQTNTRPSEQHPGTHLVFSVSRGKFSLMRPWLRRRRDSAFMSELKINPAMMWFSASCTFRTIFKFVVLSRVCKGKIMRI